MYDYKDAMKEDIRTWLDENADYIEGKDFDGIYDVLFIEDEVTGNASGSYTFNTATAREYVLENIELAACYAGELL